MSKRRVVFIDEEVVVPVHLAIWNHNLLQKKQGVVSAMGYYKYNYKTQEEIYVRVEGTIEDRVTLHSMKRLQKDEPEDSPYRYYIAPTMMQMYTALKKHDITLHEYQQNSDNDRYYLVNILDNMPVDESLYSDKYLSLFGILDSDFDYYNT